VYKVAVMPDKTEVDQTVSDAELIASVSESAGRDRGTRWGK
jgi:hypothetical protein